MTGLTERVHAVVRDVLCAAEARPLTDDTRLAEDLGADSLDAVEIMIALEDEFDLTIDDAEADRVKTVGDIMAVLRSRGLS